MNKSLLLFTILAIGAFCAPKVDLDEGVYVLTDANFDAFINSKPYALVEFYAPWCGHCKSLAPEYVKAATALKNDKSEAVLAKIDATENKEVTERYKIEGYPTLKFFIGSIENPTEYNGGRTDQEIVNWLKRRTGSVSDPIKTEAELKTFLEKHSVAIVYFGESDADQNWPAYRNLAMQNEDIAFAHVYNNAELRKSQNADNLNIVLYKHFDEKRNDYTGDYTTEHLREWAAKYSFPLVIPFNEKAIQKLFQSNHPTMFLFANESEASKSAETVFAEAAKQVSGKVLFSISKTNDGFDLYDRLAEYLGVKGGDAPVLILVSPSGDGSMGKYQFSSSTITLETITSFVTGYLEGSLEKFLKSDEIPATNDEPVKVVVGKSFNDMVINNDKDVLVEFYAPWCGHCKELAPIYDAVAKKLEKNKNILIAKVDSTTNEIDGVSIQGFPTIKFFPKGKKDQPLDFDGDRTEEGILKYLKEQTTHPWVEKDEL